MYAIYGYTMPLLSIKAHVYEYSQEEHLSLLFRYYAVKCPILHRRNKTKLRFFSVCLYMCSAQYKAKIAKFIGKVLFCPDIFANICKLFFSFCAGWGRCARWQRPTVRIWKRRATIRFTCHLLRLPPSYLTHNKQRIIHAHEREPSVCLFLVVEYWRYSRRWEQELKAQYVNI